MRACCRVKYRGVKPVLLMSVTLTTCLGSWTRVRANEVRQPIGWLGYFYVLLWSPGPAPYPQPACPGFASKICSVTDSSL